MGLGLSWRRVFLVAAVAVQPLYGIAQTAPDTTTLAQIRADIDALSAQISGLRSELIAPDPQSTGIVNPAPLQARVDNTAAEVQRLQAAIEALQLRVEKVVVDGTNRVGDLEFRLTELSGGDLSAYQDPPALGEGESASDPAALAALRPVLRDSSNLSNVQPTATPSAEDALALPQTANGSEGLGLQTDTGQAAVPAPVPDPAVAQPQTEQAAFDAAQALYRAGDYRAAEQAFSEFLLQYPGGARAGEAAFYRGESLAATGDWNNAARAYLDSFSGTPQGTKAAEALYRLGLSLGRLGRASEACLTLSEVPRRYPSISAELAAQTESERRALSCS
ncbi:MAG: tol-pal system protein YbgF [Pseudomonadota bacterium]